MRSSSIRELARLVTAGFRRLRGPYLRTSRGRPSILPKREASSRRAERAGTSSQLSLLNSFAASAAGVQALRESPIYTVEALRAYLDHLAPGGMLAITRWLGSPPRETLKLFATAIAALEAEGETSPAEAAGAPPRLEHGDTAREKRPFHRRRDRRRAPLRCRAAVRPCLVSRHDPGEANRYNRMAPPTLHDAAVALLGSGRSAFLADYKFDIRPATDDRPFFYRFFTWRLLPELVALRATGRARICRRRLSRQPSGARAGRRGCGHPDSPSARRLWRVSRESLMRRHGVRVALYFLLLGLAFLLVEIGFIHRFSLFLGHPLSAIAVTLASFLVSAGLGSGMSGRIAATLAGNRNPAVPLPPSSCLGAAYAMVLPPLFAGLMGLPLPAKIVIAAGSHRAAGLCDGPALSLGPEPPRRRGSRSRSLGLGHQWLRFGRGGGACKSPRHGIRLHRRARFSAWPLRRWRHSSSGEGHELPSPAALPTHLSSSHAFEWPLVEWSGRAPALLASEAGKGRQSTPCLRNSIPRSP